MTTIENIYSDYVKYDTTELENDLLSMIWDYKYDEEKEEFENEELEDLMHNEHHYDPKKGKASFMWIEEFKKCFNYQPGKKMYIYCKCNANGYFHAYKKVNSSYDMYIDEEGYINVGIYMYPFDYEDLPKYECYTKKVFIKPNCIYNDNIYNKIQKEEEEKEKQEKINNYEMAFKNLKSGDFINFDRHVFLVDRQSCNKYKVLKVCSKTIKCEEVWWNRPSMCKTRVVKKEKLQYHLKNFGFTITRE